jgi:type IV secretion system protein VirD4
MVSEGAGQGLLVLACLQDLSQARSRWGGAADGFLSLFGTTVVLRGIADTRTLRDLSELAGEHPVVARTVSRSVDRWGRIRPSTSVGTAHRLRLPVDALARGSAGHAIVLDPHNQVREVSLTPAHERAPWQQLVAPARRQSRSAPSRAR